MIQRFASLIRARAMATQTAHIAGAVRYPASMAPFLKESGRVPSADRFAALMSEIGVGDESLVIAYDDGNNLFAARLWWALNYYGHRQVQAARWRLGPVDCRRARCHKCARKPASR